MFGADGDRILAQREQQKAQYLADLQKQIEEKSRRPHSPSPYSTTTHDMAASPQISHTSVRNSQQSNSNQNAVQNTNNSINSTIRSNRSLDLNLNNNGNFNRNLDILKQPNRLSSRQQAPEYVPTSIASINIPLNTINNISKYSTLLPLKIDNSKAVDASKFNQRIQEIHNQALIQQENLLNFSEKESTIDQYFQNIQNHIKQIQSMINEMTSSTIPFKTSKIAKTIKEQKQIINSQQSSFESEHGIIREKYSSASNSFTAFLSKYNEFSESLKQQLLNLKSDNYRQKVAIDKSTNKITAIEQKDSQIGEKVQNKTDEFNSFDASLAQKFNEFNSNVTTLMSEYSKVLASEIRKESQYRSIVNHKLCEQISLLSQRVQSSINTVLEKNHELSNTFKGSLESLKTSISSSVNEMEGQIDSMISDTNDGINELISQTEEGFKIIQDDIIPTINASKSFSKDTFNLIEEAIRLENFNRQQNMNEILTKFDHFKNAMNDEMQIQRKAVTDHFNSFKDEETSKINDLLNPMKSETILMKNLVSNLDKYEEDLKTLESSIFTMNKQTLKSVEKLEDSFTNIKNQLDLKKSEISASFTEIERRISALENLRKSNNFIIVSDVYKINQKFENDQESKIVELEKQIDVALHALANLMGGRKPSLYTTIDQLRIDSDTESSTKPINTENEEEEEVKSEVKSEEEEEVKDNVEIEEEEEVNDENKNEEEENGETKSEEEEENVEEEEEEDSETKKKVLPIVIQVNDVDTGNISELDKPNENENQDIIKNLTFNPDDFGFKLPPPKKNDDSNSKNKNEEEEEEEEEDKDDDEKANGNDDDDDEDDDDEEEDNHASTNNYNYYNYDNVRPVC